jgi:hypothetical protein
MHRVHPATTTFKDNAVTPMTVDIGGSLDELDLLIGGEALKMRDSIFHQNFGVR